jgi:hypothetical protein
MNATRRDFLSTPRLWTDACHRAARSPALLTSRLSADKATGSGALGVDFAPDRGSRRIRLQRHGFVQVGKRLGTLTLISQIRMDYGRT